MELVEKPTMIWIVAGKSGMELHGYRVPTLVEEAVAEGVEPDAIVAIHPLHWDFRFPQTDGSGRVRVGAGCQYNPLQMIEAMYGHVCDVDSDSEIIHLDFNPDDLVFDPNKPFGDSFLDTWGDGDLA
jgi:hypothetical protein